MFIYEFQIPVFWIINVHYIQTKNIHSPQDLDTIADWFILPCDFVIVEVLRHNKSNTV